MDNSEYVFPAKTGFHIVDYLIFGTVLMISIGIGIWHAFTKGGQKTPQEFLQANKKLHVIPSSLSMMVIYVFHKLN